MDVGLRSLTGLSYRLLSVKRSKTSFNAPSDVAESGIAKDRKGKQNATGGLSRRKPSICTELFRISSKVKFVSAARLYTLLGAGGISD
jgi:hypothetical protein